jgi:hypothetical protein
MQAAVHRYLDDLIEVQELQVTNDEAALRIEMKYRLRRTQQQFVAHFSQKGGA